MFSLLTVAFTTGLNATGFHSGKMEEPSKNTQMTHPKEHLVFLKKKKKRKRKDKEEEEHGAPEWFRRVSIQLGLRSGSCGLWV